MHDCQPCFEVQELTKNNPNLKNQVNLLLVLVHKRINQLMPKTRNNSSYNTHLSVLAKMKGSIKLNGTNFKAH